MSNLAVRLDEVLKNQAIIDRLTRSNSLIMESIARDAAVTNLIDLPGLTSEVRSMLTAVLNGQATPIAPQYPENRERTTTQKQLSEVIDVPAASSPQKRKYTKKAKSNGSGEKVPHGFHAELMVEFAKKNGKRFDMDGFKREHAHMLNPNFLRGTVYAIRSSLVKKGIFEPMKSDPTIFKLNTAAV